MALQFPTYQPNDVLGSLLSGYQAGMDMRTRYEDVKRDRQAEAAQQAIAKAALMAGQQRNINPADQQLQQSPNVLLRALQGLGMSVTPLDVNQPTPQQPQQSYQQPYQAMQIPTQASAMATPRQLPLAQTPADQFTPASTQPAPDQSAATLATGMTKRGSLPAMSDYIFGRPSTTGPNPVLNVIQTRDGRTVLLPSRINGKRLDINQARAYYKKTGQHLGEFESPEAAMKYAYSLASNTLEPEPQPMQPEAISGATLAPTSEISPAPMAEQVGMETQPDQAQPTPAPQPPAQPSARSFLALGKQYGLTDDIMRKYPVQALQYIQGRQAQEQSQTKASFDLTKDAITAIESGKTPRDRAAIAQQYASMGVISPAMAQSLATKPSADMSGVQVVPIDKYSEMIRYTDPDTGETKTSIRSTSDKENPSQWISQLYDNDPKVAAMARRKLDEYNRMQQQKIQFGVNVRERSAKDMVDYKAESKLKYDARGNPSGWNSYTPAEKKFFFDQQFATGQPTVRFAFGDKQSWTQYNKDLAAYAGQSGVTGADVAVNKAQYKALSSSLQQQQKSIGAMGGFARNLNKQISRVNSIGNDLVSRVGVRALNVPIRELKLRFKGDPNEAILTAYTLEISNEIGKLSTGSSASISELSVDAQKKWEKVHDPNLTINQLKKILNETSHMANMRVQSANEQVSETQRQLKALGATGKPTSGPTATRRPIPATKPASGRRVLSSAEVKKIKFL